MGFLLDEEGLRPDPDKIAPVMEYPAAKNLKELRRFLGIMGWYSRFIARESEHKVQFTKHLKKTQAWEWEEKQQATFEALKLALCSAPVLVRPNFSRFKKTTMSMSIPLCT